MLYRDRIDYSAVNYHAREISLRHEQLLAAGRYWGGLLGLVADRIETFAREVAFQTVRGIMLAQGSLDDYRLHLSASPQGLPSPILLFACQECNVDPRRLPQGVTTYVCPQRFEVLGRATL